MAGITAVSPVSRKTAIEAVRHPRSLNLGQASLGFLRLGISVCTLTTLACATDDLVLPPGAEPSQIELVQQGNGQQGSAGMPLPLPVVVRLVDEAGIGVPGREVTWVVSAGGGSTTPVGSETNADGLASAQWILGPSAGANTLDARVSGIGTVTFTATAGGGDGGGDGDGDGSSPSASRSTVSADPTAIQAGSGTATIRVTVRDEAGAPFAGAVVTLVVSGSGNTLTQPGGVTGPDGLATGTLRSTVAGTKDVNAVVNGSVQLDQSAQVSVAEGPPPPPPPTPEPDHFVFRVPPRDVERDERFRVEVALVDAAGNVVPLSGIEIYLGLFQEGNDGPSNTLLSGDRFRDTENGVAVFNLAVTRKGRYRFRALSDDLPALGPHGPEPFLFSSSFKVD